MTRIQIALRYLPALACSIAIAFAADPKHTYMPPAGYVPDSNTAIKIVVAVWEPIYGARKSRGKTRITRRYTMMFGLLLVQLPERMLGGVAIAEISKQDGRIIRVSHSK
jgi:NTF2 fold immunity protein of polymorphic toxin system component